VNWKGCLRRPLWSTLSDVHSMLWDVSTYLGMVVRCFRYFYTRMSRQESQRVNLPCKVKNILVRKFHYILFYLINLSDHNKAFSDHNISVWSRLICNKNYKRSFVWINNFRVLSSVRYFGTSYRHQKTEFLNRFITLLRLFFFLLILQNFLWNLVRAHTINSFFSVTCGFSKFC
jgi:hypothetical protein